MIDGFSAAFGAAFDASVHTVTNLVGAGRVCIGGIDFLLRPTADAFDVEIPEINAVYTHMLGHDCHSIVAGQAHADSIIAELREDIARGYDLILTSHYTPEDLKDAQTKIDYLESLKRLAARRTDAEASRPRCGKPVSVVQRAELFGYDGGLFLRLRRRLSGRKGGIRA